LGSNIHALVDAPERGKNEIAWGKEAPLLPAPTVHRMIRTLDLQLFAFLLSGRWPKMISSWLDQPLAPAVSVNDVAKKGHKSHPGHVAWRR
jgi:hypothetical protein